MTESISLHDVVTAALDRFILDGRLKPRSPMDARLLAAAVAHTIQTVLLERGYEIRRKEAVPADTTCRPAEQDRHETTSNDAQGG